MLGGRRRSGVGGTPFIPHTPGYAADGDCAGRLGIPRIGSGAPSAGAVEGVGAQGEGGVSHTLPAFTPAKTTLEFGAASDSAASESSTLHNLDFTKCPPQ